MSGPSEPRPGLILAGADLSPGGWSAVRLACAWARRWRAAVRVVHAMQVAAAREDLVLALAAGARAAAGAAGGSAPGVEVVPGDGEPAARLAARARADAAWLAVGCEGTSAHALRTGGSVVRRLARESPVPLLVAPPRWSPPRSRRRGPPAFERLIVGLGGGGSDPVVLATAARLVPTGGVLSACHVQDVSPLRFHPARARAEGEAAARQRADAVRAAHGDLLDAVVDPGAPSGPTVPLEVIRQGPVHADLAGLARSQAADLLVVGTGRVAARLVGVTTVPLLVLPGPAA